WSCRWYAWWLHNIEAVRIAGLEHGVAHEMLVAYVEAVGNAEWFCPFDGFVACVERPKKLTVDPEGNLHSETGKAIEYRDGWGLSFWRGTHVPDEWLTHKDTLDPAIALTWENVEQRHAAGQIIGWDKVLAQLNPRVLDRDPNPHFGELLEADLPGIGAQKFLRAKCGTGRDVVLMVSPEARTAVEAGAMSYRVPVEVYKQQEFRT